MNKFVKMTAMIAVAATLLAGCGDDDDTTKTPAAPTIEMVGANIDDVHEITEQMSVKVAVASEAGIGRFDITIESPMLTNEFLTSVGLAAQMELVSASGSMASMLKGFGFPVGDEVKDAKTLSFDISQLVPLIAELGHKTSNHNFVLKVTDVKGQSTTKTLKFHLTGTSSVVYNNDADLWANTATLTVSLAEAAQSVALQYKKSTETDWQQTPPLTAGEDGKYVATISPTWVAAADHASGAKQYTLDNKTGVFAGNTYDFRAVVDGNVIEDTAGQFTAGQGDGITDGNMDSWSKTLAYNAAFMEDPEANAEYAVYYPNASAEREKAFWANGNNSMTMELCQPFDLADNTKAAKLKGKFMWITFAAGNLFTGIFDFVNAELSGYARFGQKYEFTARPSALKVRYRATITNYTYVSKLKEGELTTDMIDNARIFVCITDWNERHSVMSGMGALGEGGIDKINAFDPETQATTDEGKVLAYGSKWIDASTPGEDWVELVIPLLYKEAERDTKPAADKYSLVISTASSAYGDFLSGSENNELYLDNFEWVY